MKTAKIKEACMAHIHERDKRIKRMAKLLRQMAQKGAHSIITPEDLEKMEAAARAAENSI